MTRAYQDVSQLAKDVTYRNELCLYLGVKPCSEATVSARHSVVLKYVPMPVNTTISLLMQGK
jgi:hypothetical protein